MKVPQRLAERHGMATARPDHSGARLLLSGGHAALASDPGRPDVLLESGPDGRGGVWILCGQVYGYTHDRERLLHRLRRILTSDAVDSTCDLEAIAVRLDALVKELEPLAYIAATLADLPRESPAEILSAGGPPALVQTTAKTYTIPGPGAEARPLGLGRTQPRTAALPTGARALLATDTVPFDAPHSWLDHATAALAAPDLLAALAHLGHSDAAAIVIQTAAAQPTGPRQHEH